MSKKSPLFFRVKSRLDRLRNEWVLAVFVLSLSGALVVLPRPTYPQVLPLPVVDRQQAAARENEEVRRALLARDGSLDKDVRAIGEQVRRLGLVLSIGRPVKTKALTSLRRDARRLLRRKEKKGTISGATALLQLRALQAQLFLDAVHRWEKGGEADVDLRELGGSFHQVAADSWRTPQGKLLLDDDQLRLFFRMHWGKVTGLDSEAPFEPTLEELRRYYLANLLYPSAPPSDLHGRARSQINFVRALGKVDAKYPAELAEGILHLKMGQSFLAMEALKGHLAKHRDGPWTQVAKCHLLLAVRQTDAVRGAGL